MKDILNVSEFLLKIFQKQDYRKVNLWQTCRLDKRGYGYSLFIVKCNLRKLNISQRNITLKIEP